MKKYIEEGCEYEAAKEVRNERNLLYVAVTRAKENVYISYHLNLTELIENPIDNSYSYLDNIYNHMKKDYDDVNAFIKLFNLKNSSYIKRTKEDSTNLVVSTENIEDMFTDISEV